jgi:hypothetical protein
MDQQESFAKWARFHAERARQRRNARISLALRGIGWAALIAAMLAVGYMVSLIPAKIAATVLEAQEERPKW